MPPKFCGEKSLMDTPRRRAETKNVTAFGPRRVVLQLPTILIVVREPYLRTAGNESILDQDRRHDVVAVLFAAVRMY